MNMMPLFYFSSYDNVYLYVLTTILEKYIRGTTSLKKCKCIFYAEDFNGLNGDVLGNALIYLCPPLNTLKIRGGQRGSYYTFRYPEKYDCPAPTTFDHPNSLKFTLEFSFADFEGYLNDYWHRWKNGYPIFFGRSLFKAKKQLQLVVSQIIEASKIYSSGYLPLEQTDDDNVDFMACLLFLRKHGVVAIHDDLTLKNDKLWNCNIEIIDEDMLHSIMSNEAEDVSEIVREHIYFDTLKKQLVYKKEVIHDFYTSPIGDVFQHSMQSGGVMQITIEELKKHVNLNQTAVRTAITNFNKIMKKKLIKFPNLKIGDDPLVSFLGNSLIAISPIIRVKA